MGGDRVTPTVSKEQIVQLMERPDRLQLDWLLREFPKEISTLCDLAHVPPGYNLIPFLMQLTAIISLYRARYENVQGAEQAVRDLEKGIAYIRRAMQGFPHINYFLLEATLLEVREQCPSFRELNVRRALEVLDEFCVLARALSGAMRSAANAYTLPRRRGDKSDYYFLPTIPLIELWESIASIQQEGGARRSRKDVPTPKRVPGVDDAGKKLPFISKQPSTEFLKITLRMIYPTITDAQVFTAIKKARKTRRSLYSHLCITNIFGFDEALGVRI